VLILRAGSHDQLRRSFQCAHAARAFRQVHFWDVTSGQQVRQVSGWEFAFVEGDASQHQAGRYFLTASTVMLLIYERDAGGNAASAAACFGAPFFTAKREAKNQATRKYPDTLTKSAEAWYRVLAALTIDLRFTTASVQAPMRVVPRCVAVSPVEACAVRVQ